MPVIKVYYNCVILISSFNSKFDNAAQSTLVQVSKFLLVKEQNIRRSLENIEPLLTLKVKILHK